MGKIDGTEAERALGLAWELCPDSRNLVVLGVRREYIPGVDNTTRFKIIGGPFSRMLLRLSADGQALTTRPARPEESDLYGVLQKVVARLREVEALVRWQEPTGEAKADPNVAAE